MSNSPNSQSSPLPAYATPHKRPRPIQSCLNCRSKKLKCDRHQPCLQCVKRDRPRQCEYVEHTRRLGRTVDESSANQAPALINGRVTSRVGDYGVHPEESRSLRDDALPDLQQRIAELERRISQTSGSYQSPRTDSESNRVRPTRESYMENQVSMSTQHYHGLSGTRWLVALFPEIKSFTAQVLGDPEMQVDMQKLHLMFPKEKRSPTRAYYVEVDSILTLIPSRDICNHFVHLYTSNFEAVYRILHVPTFIQQCDRFWNSQEDLDPVFKIDFIPQLALVCVIGSRLHPDSIQGSQHVDPRNICDLVHSWLHSLHGNQRARLSTIQTTCLLALAKQLNFDPPSEIWQVTGDMVRSALAIDLHRDPDELLHSAMPNLQAELRRRLWYAVAEMDLQASISCCKPSLVQAIEYSCLFPADMEDDELVREAEDTAPRSKNSFTQGTSFQLALAKSMPARLRASQLLTRLQPAPEDVNHTLNDLENQYSFLHQSLKGKVVGTQPSQLTNSILLDMCYRRPMISLYTLGLQNKMYLDISGIQSTAAKCIQFFMAVMSHSGSLSLDTREHEAFSDNRYFHIFQALHQDDVIRSAYSACLCMNLMGTASDTMPFNALSWPIPAVRRFVQDILEMFLKRGSNPRNILKQLLGLALVLKSTLYATNGPVREDQMRHDLKQMLQLCEERYIADGNEPLDLEHSKSFSMSEIFSQSASNESDLGYMNLDWDFPSLLNFEMPEHSL